MYWYCQQALDILSPGNGKELHQNIITIEKQFTNQKTQRALNSVVDNLLELCLYASNWEIKRLAFVQLCGALSMKELNIRLQNRRRQVKYDTTGGTDESSADITCARLIQRKKYMTGKKMCEFLYANGELPQKNYRLLLTENISLHVLAWIKSICPLEWKPYSVQTYVLGGAAYKFNKLLRSDSIRKICAAYAEHHERSGWQDFPGTFRPGRHTLRSFLKYVTERTRKKACLSYYYVRLIETFAMYERLISQCESHHAEALADYDILYPCLDAQRVIRTRLVTPEVTNILPLALIDDPISHPYLYV